MHGGAGHVKATPVVLRGNSWEGLVVLGKPNQGQLCKAIACSTALRPHTPSFFSVLELGCAPDHWA